MLVADLMTLLILWATYIRPVREVISRAMKPLNRQLPTKESPSRVSGVQLDIEIQSCFSPPPRQD